MGNRHSELACGNMFTCLSFVLLPISRNQLGIVTSSIELDEGWELITPNNKITPFCINSCDAFNISDEFRDNLPDLLNMIADLTLDQQIYFNGMY